MRLSLGVDVSCQACGMKPEPGDHVELEVSNVAHGGVSVARLDGRVVFVGDAIPGERVVAELTDVAHKSFWRATTVRVLEASEHRREHVWSAASIDRAPAERAGGAEFGHIALDHQRELKRQVLADAMQRFGGEETGAATDVVVEPVCDGSGWRTRVRLHVGEHGVPGPFAARSHTVIPVSDLPLAVPQLAEVAPLTKETKLTKRFDPGAAIDLVAPSVGRPMVLLGTANRDARDELLPITERVGEREFQLDARGFWQVHHRAAETLTAAVADAIDPARFEPDADNLDLYGGVGLLAAALADAAGTGTGQAGSRSGIRVTSVESNRRATDYAARNLAEWPGASAVTARVDRFVRDAVNRNAASGNPESGSRRAGATIVLDPPRSGAEREVIDGIAQLRPAQVVYVACDPVALARDVGYFKGHGWRLAKLRAFDLFPHTHHLEAVALLLPELRA